MQRLKGLGLLGVFLLGHFGLPVGLLWAHETIHRAHGTMCRLAHGTVCPFSSHHSTRSSEHGECHFATPPCDSDCAQASIILDSSFRPALPVTSIILPAPAVIPFPLSTGYIPSPPPTGLERPPRQAT